MSDIEKAKEIFSSQKYTCVLCKGDITYKSTATGVKPMLGFIENETDLVGFSAADKIIGKAAAMLFVLAGVKEVYGTVISQGAADVFKQNSIEYTYSILTDKIINRAGDDICPMEKAVDKISSPLEAYSAIKHTIEKLRSGKNGN